MIRHFIIACVLLLSSSVHAQQLVAGEYFFDTEPGAGNGTAFTITATDSVISSLNVPVNTLGTGFHQMYIRVKDILGRWSHYEGRPFYIIEPYAPISGNTAPLQAGEWFIDTDPGLGNATAFTFAQGDSVNTAVSIPTAGLSPGFHQLYMRVKTTAERWSLYEGRPFYIIEPNTPLISDNSTLVSAEWFIDTDPGFGNGTAINFSANDSVHTIISPNVGSMATGLHHLYIRVKNASGKWSLWDRQPFRVCTSLMASSVISGTNIACVGSTLVLSGTAVPDASNYIWEGPNGYTAVGLSMSRSNVTAAMAGEYKLYAIRAGATACDTAVSSIQISVNEPSIPQSISASICVGDAYNFNGTLLTQAGTYNDTLVNAAGCDSIITLSLNTKATYSINNPQAICEGSVYSFNNHHYTLAGSYNDTLQSALGCDSIIVTQLTVHPVASATLSAAICSGNTYNFNGTLLTQAGMYLDTLQNQYGCDSVISLALNVNNSTVGDTTAIACGSFTWYGTTYTASGTASHVLINAAGCDSTVTLNLTINTASSANLNASICAGDTYDFNGTLLTQAGTYMDTLQNSNACDSLISLNLNVTNVDKTINQNQAVLTANQAGASYQWLNCDSSSMAIAGATAQSYTVTQSGNYAVAISFDNCSDTSNCVSVIVSGIGSSVWQHAIKIYPNPANEILHVSNVPQGAELSIVDVTGKVLFSSIQSGGEAIINTSAIVDGLYVISIRQEHNILNKKLIIHR